jgi:hypothetical protein
MRTGNGGRKIEDAKALKALRRIVRGVSPFCHSGAPELMYPSGAETLSAAAIAGKRLSAWDRRGHRRSAGFDASFAAQRKLDPFLHSFN